MSDGQFAQTVLASSLITTFLLGGLLFGFREELVEYVTADLQTKLNAQPVSSFVPSGQENQIIETIAKANPAVVSVIITKEVPVYEEYFEEFNPFGGFFGFSVPRLRESGTEERQVGGGSGFIVSPDGLVVTNRHVVADTEASYTVISNTGESFSASVVDRDPVLDIAILQIDDVPVGEVLPHLEFGNSDTLQLGQSVIAIGNALAEFNNSVSVGIVSGLSRSIIAGNRMGMSEQLDEVIQTDAAINPGNSGGPLLNTQGEVIGVNVAATIGAENIAFALPANAVRSVVASVERYGEIVRPFIGVRYAMIGSGLNEIEELSVDYGALVVRGQGVNDFAVMPGSPAAAVGLSEGDVILAIDGEELRGTSLAQVIREKEVGQEVELRVLQGGEVRTIMLELGESSD